jgi:7-cyano-7-deazaguanine synthase
MILLRLFIKLVGMYMKNKTGILLSGGMDSMALAYWKKPNLAFTIDYGQRCSEAEIETSAHLCKELQIEHHIIRVDCSSLGSGTLSGNPSLENAPSEEWWPYRNQLLVTLACMKGISLGLKTLYVGSVKPDGDRHADGKKEFYNILSSLIEFQEGSIKIEMPAYNMDTVQLIRRSGIPYSMLLWSHSCHTSNHPCLHCSGCIKNLEVRKVLGID